MHVKVASIVAVFLVFASASVQAQSLMPSTFDTPKQCQTALESGQFRFYVPDDFRGNSKMPVDGKVHVLVPLPRNACVHMVVVDGWKWVPQPEGTAFRAQRKDGMLVLYARDDCGNTVDGILYPSAVAPVRGEIGLTGPTGPTGANGATGSQGSPGLRGLTGGPGSRGNPGLQGEPGPPGRDGLNGQDGHDGRDTIVIKKAGFPWKKTIIVGLIGGAVGATAYYYWPCPPGSIRR